jgi:hypothetical protein
MRNRDFENVMLENAYLQSKLENLENVFIGTTINKGANKSSESYFI